MEESWRNGNNLEQFNLQQVKDLLLKTPSLLNDYFISN